ncbi:MAG: ubiquinone biosynthesis monooxygenase Coq7 [Gammaproteobacteria bacterium]|jgi:ubiquinone biosynthesis monooxygenase Coq7
MPTVDTIIVNLDRALRAVGGATQGTGRVFPAQDLESSELSRGDRARSAGLMRVNHAGEVAAQALYHGQSLTARSSHIRAGLEQAAREEEDHLIWCRRRLRELHASPSALDPLWYAGSFALGALAGVAGDRVNLGFLAETEHQVAEHLQGHLHCLPADDERSRAVVSQMCDDEAEHARMAERGGAMPLPVAVKKMMKFASAVMTRTAFWL